MPQPSAGNAKLFRRHPTWDSTICFLLIPVCEEQDDVLSGRGALIAAPWIPKHLQGLHSYDPLDAHDAHDPVPEEPAHPPTVAEPRGWEGWPASSA